MSKGTFTYFRQVLLGSVALALCAGTASAQPAAPVPADQGKIEKVTVTAQKRKQNAQDIPGTVDALNSKNIKDLGITSSDKIAQFVPGVTINLPSGQGNQPIVSIRGIGNNDFNTNNAGPNGIYSDEVYLSAPSSQTFLTFDLDRIEVLKGPQGTLYGRNTSGGAINFISNKPVLDEFGVGATASYSSYNTYLVEGFVNAATGDTSAARLAATWNSSDGFMRNLVNGERVSGTDGYAGRGQWLVKPAENFEILFNLHGSKVDTLPTEYHQVGAAQFNGVGFDPCTRADIDAGLCTDVFFYNGPTDRYKGNYDSTKHLENDSAGGSVRADYDIGDVTLTSISAIENNDKLHPENSDASPLSLLEIDFGVDSSTFTQELRAAGGGEKSHWLVGLYYLGETLNQNQSIDVLHDADLVYGAGAGECNLATLNTLSQSCAFTGFARSKQKTTAYAVFGQADFEIADATRLTLGGRFTNESKDFNLTGAIIGQSGGYGVFSAPQALWAGGYDDDIEKSAFSWKVAIDHHFTEKVMAYASIATGFKSGGFNGGFLDVNKTFADSQEAPVRSETNNAYEIGFKADLLDDTFRLNASGFYYDYKDLQLHTLVQQPGGFPVDVLDNAQKATIKGVDVEAIAKPVENLTLRMTAEWLEATLDKFISNRGSSPLQNLSGNTLPNAPKFSLTGIAEYTIPLGDGDAIDLLASAAYRSKVFFDPANEPLISQGAYWVIDARAAYTIDDGKWQVAVFGRNLTDEEYVNMAFDLRSSFGLLQEVVAPPLTIGVEASFHY
ncbi:MAG: TonB-dependent receptor [Alphaproteobacteria bacterium]|nr:TonB-dependent receptor [Alphaproteobacteria bacterium]